MNADQRQKVYEKPLKKAANSFLFLILSVIAIFIGVQFGNLWYHLDMNIIDKIDVESFKRTVSFSIPIIETVYNSGKSSVSFSGEIKELLTGIFGFDLHTPSTIFSAQSALFRLYQDRLDTGEQGTGSAPAPEDPDSRKGQGTWDTPGQGTVPYGGDTGQGAVPHENDSGQDTAPNEGGTGQDRKHGNGSDGQTGTGSDGSGGSGSGKADTGESTTESSINTETWPGSSLAWASSISWETETEEKDDRTNVVEIEKIAIKNNTKYKIDVEKLLKKPLNLDLSKKGPKVLVYHTHTSESYVLKESDLGKKDVPSFNSNPKYNVVRVGEELARNLRKYGIETLHNGTVHDKVRDAAYGVSIDTLNSYKKSYPSIQIYIDVHRDAANSDQPKLRMTKEINGKNCAQIMFVVGAEGTLPHPKWQENLSFVLKLQQKLNEKYPGLARPIWIVEARYNQHISTQSILIEVGGDGNLLSECLESTKYLAEALNDVIEEWG